MAGADCCWNGAGRGPKETALLKKDLGGISSDTFKLCCSVTPHLNARYSLSMLFKGFVHDDFAITILYVFLKRLIYVLLASKGSDCQSCLI